MAWSYWEKYTSLWQRVCRLQLPILANTKGHFFLEDFVLKNHTVLQASWPVCTTGAKYCCCISEYPEMEQFYHSNSISLLISFSFYSVILIKPLQFWYNFCVKSHTCVPLVMRWNSFFLAVLCCVQSGFSLLVSRSGCCC